MRSVTALAAYRKSATHRSVREQEADVFLRVNAVLRGAREGSMLDRARAFADNGRLWTAVMDLMRDPENALSTELRAAVISVGMAVRKEISATEPDIGFLIGINDQMAAALTGSG